jgi:glycosyltransferase involved in cell wall biosynthesis
MALGVPTVCFASGALQEVVVDGETGLICRESAGALAGALDRFLADPGFRSDCGNRAKRRYEQRYSRHVVRPMWVAFFESIAPRRRVPSSGREAADTGGPRTGLAEPGARQAE